MTKKNLLLVSLLFVLGLGLVAPYAAAQEQGYGTTFNVTGSLYYLRPNSVGDAAGPVYITYASGYGTLAGAETLAVTFSAPIVGATGVAAAPVGDFCYDGDVNTGLNAPPVPVCGSGDISVSALKGNAKVLLVTVGKTPIAGFTSGTISIWGLRFNTVNMTPQSTITATVSVYLQNQEYPVSFGTTTNTLAAPVTVGQVGYNPTYGWGSVSASVVSPITMLTCYMGKTEDFTLNVTEQWSGAWTSPTDENTLAPYLAPLATTLGSEIAVTFSGVPSGATLAAVSTTKTAGTAFGWVTSTPTPITLTNGNVVFVFELSNTTREEIEGTNFEFSITTGGAIATQLAPITASVTLYPNTPASPPPYPAFTYPTTGPTMEEPTFPLTLVSFLGCQTNLLFPYVTNYDSGSSGGALGNWDTAIVISNTSSDPYTSEVTIYGDPAGATPTAGSCSISVYAASSGSLTPSSDATPVAIWNTAPVYTGGVLAFMLSGTAAKGVGGGYAIAVCNFLNGTGYAEVVDNANGLGNWGVMGSYLAYVIPNPVEDPRWYNAQWGEFAITPFPWYNYFGDYPYPNLRKGTAKALRAPSIR